MVGPVYRARRPTLALLAAVALIASGAAHALANAVPEAAWTEFQYSVDDNAVFASPSWRVFWRTDVGKRINGGLAIVGSKLYAESFDKNTYAIDARTGQKIWEQPADNIVMSTPLITDGVVIAGSGTGLEMVGSSAQSIWARAAGDAIYGFDAQTGSVRWRFPTTGEDMATGVVVRGTGGNRYVFCNGDGHAYALDVTTGRLLWKSALPGSCLMSNLSWDGGRVFGSSGFSWELIYALAQRHDPAAYRTLWTWSLNPEDGNLIWTNSPGSVHGGTTVGAGMVFDEFAEPTSWRDPNAVITAADNALRLNVVSGFDERTGALRWQYVSAGGPVVQIGSRVIEYQGLYQNGTLYQTLPLPSQFAAFEAHTGRIRWMLKTDASVKMTAVMRNGLLYFGDERGNLYVVRAQDGAVEQRVKFPSYFTCSPPIIVGDTLFVANGRSIYALRLDRLAQDAVALTREAPVGPPF